MKRKHFLSHLLLICHFILIPIFFVHTHLLGNNIESNNSILQTGNTFISQTETNTALSEKINGKPEKLKLKSNDYKVVRGERPPINLKSLSQDIWEKGKIHVKFKPSMSEVLPFSHSTHASDKGYVETGKSILDLLNQKFAINEYKPLLDGLYDKSPESMQNQERHKAWGFHLWYELKFDLQTDILEMLDAFNSHPDVEYAEPVFKKRLIEPVGESKQIQKDEKYQKATPNDSFYADFQWHYNNTGQMGGRPGVDISLEKAWDIETGNPNIIVAIVDDGIYFNHPDLQANMWQGIGPEGTSTTPGNHGTHVAGTVSAVTNNGIGVAGIAGGNGSGNGVKLMSIDILKGNHNMSDLALYIYQVTHNVAISQNSWGYLSPNAYNQSALDGIDYFNANGGGDALLGGGIAIFASGNDNDNQAWYPAFYSGAMAVSSFDNTGVKSDFSNYGSWIDISGPGTNIASTYYELEYAFESGTSMACPHVSGVAALILSHVYGVLTPAQLWDLLVQNVDNIDIYNPSYTGLLGSGGLNAHRALLAARTYIDNGDKPEEIIIFYEDFNGSMPAGWQNVVHSPAGFPGFEWTTTGGEFGGQLNSTTSGNGYLIVDSDKYGAVGATENVDLISPTIDFTQHKNLNSIVLRLEHMARTNGSAEAYIYISTDNFSTQTLLYEWKNAEQHESNTETNPLVSEFDITQIANNQPIVKLKFKHIGEWDYWWLIDDVKVIAMQESTGGGELEVVFNQPKAQENLNSITSATRGNENYEVAENFSGLNAEVKQLTFYGLYAIYSNDTWNNVDPGNQLNFNVRFYPNNEVQPDWNNPIAQYLNLPSSSITAEPAWDNGFNVWKFELNIPVTFVNNGWVSIQSVDGNGWFLWHNSFGGDSYAWQKYHTSKNYGISHIGNMPAQKSGSLDHDMALEIYGTTSQNQFTLTLNSNPAVGGSVSGQGQYGQGNPVQVKATANSGYTFSSWSNANNNIVSTIADFTFTMPSAHTTLTANFIADQSQNYTLTLNASPASAGSVSGAGQYQRGQQITITATANAGYNFSGWVDGNFQLSENETYVFNMPVGDLNLTALFVPIDTQTYKLTLEAISAEGGTVEGGGDFPEGTDVIVTAIPTLGFSFLRWFRLGGGIVSTIPKFLFTMPAEDVTLQVFFESFESITSTDNHSLNTIKIFPNPASDRISITAQGTIDLLVISDLSGRRVWHEKIASSATTISTDTFESGIYFLQIHTHNTVLTKKLQIQK